MPLRAILDNQDVVAPALTSGEWQTLRQETRAGIHTLRLPCCSSRAFQRTSPRGLQHFYHPPGLPCDERGETLDHLDAKLAILHACERAGYKARPEVCGDGWRADVLCVR